MTWGEGFDDVAQEGHDESIEVVGTNIRMTGVVSLGRFKRLSDMINASSGYLRVRDACLLHRTGQPSDLELPELMVDQDEISFIAQTHPNAPEEGSGGGFDEPTFESGVDARQAREFVMFTPAHTVSGKVFIFGQTNLAAFVDSTSPRFVPVIDATTRWLADRKVVNRYDFLLINRTQMIAAAELGGQADIALEDLPNL